MTSLFHVFVQITVKITVFQYIQKQEIYFIIFENFYDSLITQHSETKKFIRKTISYHQRFEAFTMDEQEQYNLTSNKNSKYLPYRFNG